MAVLDRFRIEAHGEPGSQIGPFRIARLAPDQIEQLLLGQPDQRSAQQRDQREGVAGVGQHPRDCNEVLHLLATVEALPGLRCDRHPALF